MQEFFFILANSVCYTTDTYYCVNRTRANSFFFYLQALWRGSAKVISLCKQFTHVSAHQILINMYKKATQRRCTTIEHIPTVDAVHVYASWWPLLSGECACCLQVCPGVFKCVCVFACSADALDKHTQTHTFPLHLGGKTVDYAAWMLYKMEHACMHARASCADLYSQLYKLRGVSRIAVCVCVIIIMIPSHFTMCKIVSFARHLAR